MAKHYRRSDNQELKTKIILLITAILNLIRTLIDFIKSLIG